MKTFRPAGYDFPAHYCTYALPVLWLSVITMFCVMVTPKLGYFPVTHAGFVAAMLGAFSAVQWAVAVRRYSLGENGLTVERNLAPPLIVPFSGISSITLATNGELGITGFRFFTRSWAMFGHSGRRHLDSPGRLGDLGRCRLAATTMAEAVILQCRHDWPLVISPESADAFVAELRPRLSAPPAGAAEARA